MSVDQLWLVAFCLCQSPVERGSEPFQESLADPMAQHSDEEAERSEVLLRVQQPQQASMGLCVDQSAVGSPQLGPEPSAVGLERQKGEPTPFQEVASVPPVPSRRCAWQSHPV